MTLQEAYEGIVAWFSRPDAVLGWDDVAQSCVYRGNGEANSPVRCAAGCLISDEKYDPEIEYMTVLRLPVQRALGIENDSSGLVYFLKRVQQLHDQIANARRDDGPAYFVERLHDLARTHRLNVS